MDFDAIVAAYFAGDFSDAPTPAPVAAAGNARRLRDAFEPLAMHAVWSRLVHERLSRFGLDFFGGYVYGRACVLGEPTGAVIAASFASFEPGLIASVWADAHPRAPRDTVLTTVVEATGESLRQVLGDGEQAAVASVAARLQDAVAAADGTGRALFSAVQALDVPDDPYAALWQATLALREHRGDAHVIAYLAQGFDAVQMNILTELWLGYPLGAYSGTRAWSEARTEQALTGLRLAGLLDASNELTDAGRATRDDLEARTDRLCAAPVRHLGDDLDGVAADLRRWSDACVGARAFPPDPRKRAAG
ncbi:MAG: hypothetical protein AB7W59_29945 [Acidimicrobiia bacterium]